MSAAMPYALNAGDAAASLDASTSTTLAAPRGVAVAESENPALIYLASLSPGSSQITMASTIAVVARLFGSTITELPWHGLRALHVHALRARLQTFYAPTSTNKALCAVRSILRVANELELIPDAEFFRAIRIKSVKGTRLPPGRAIARRELMALFKACETGRPAGARNAAVLALLYGAGLRRAEVVALDTAALQGGNALKVIGKGNKERLLYLPRGAQRAIEAWMRVRGDEPGPLFFACSRSRIIEPRRRLSNAQVMETCKWLVKMTGLAHFSAHDFRRSFVGDLLDAGIDLVTVQKLAGHSSPETTARYDRRGERTKIEAAEALFVPFAVDAKDAGGGEPSSGAPSSPVLPASSSSTTSAASSPVLPASSSNAATPKAHARTHR